MQIVPVTAIKPRWKYPSLMQGVLGVYEPCLNGCPGKIYDVSGNGNHATFSASANAQSSVKLGYGAFSSSSICATLARELTTVKSVIVGFACSGDTILVGGASANRQIRAYTSGANTLAAYNGAFPASSTLSPAIGSLMCGAWILDGSGNITFYANGKAYGSGAFSSATTITIGQINGQSGSTLFAGSVMEIVLSSRVWTPQEAIWITSQPPGTIIKQLQIPSVIGVTTATTKVRRNLMLRTGSRGVIA
jgi:hypothetical protein